MNNGPILDMPHRRRNVRALVYKIFIAFALIIGIVAFVKVLRMDPQLPPPQAEPVDITE